MAPICFAVPVWLRGSGPFMQLATTSVGYGGRYAATSILMLVSAVLVLAGHLSTVRRGRGPGQLPAQLPEGAVGASPRAPTQLRAAWAALLAPPPGGAARHGCSSPVASCCCPPGWRISGIRTAAHTGRRGKASFRSPLRLAGQKAAGESWSIAIDPNRWDVSPPVPGSHPRRTRGLRQSLKMPR